MTYHIKDMPLKADADAARKLQAAAAEINTLRLRLADAENETRALGDKLACTMLALGAIAAQMDRNAQADAAVRKQVSKLCQIG